MPRFRMVISYDGSGFHGFARQPDQRTVQGVLEEALTKISGSQVKLTAAGRTDAGVHALGQVVSFELPEPAPSDLSKRLASMSGPELAVISTVEVSEDFDARFSAESRTYEYAILNREVADPFSRHTTWHIPDSLDVESMRRAAQHLIGEFDFSSFGRIADGKSPMRRVTSVEIDRQEDLILIRITANSFVQQMVRSLVGTLVKVGQGGMKPDEMAGIIEAKDREAAGPVAPPHGLFLTSVGYPADKV